MPQQEMTQIGEGQFIARLPGIAALMIRRGDEWEAGQFSQEGFLSRAEVEQRLMQAFPHLRWTQNMRCRNPYFFKTSTKKS